MKQIKKVFIMSIFQKTGGPESLHQMAASMRKQGVDAYICYFTKEAECLYDKYADSIKIASRPEDDAENIIIVPEIHIEMLNNFHNAKKVICWLSWDFYEKYTLTSQSEKWSQKGKIKAIRKILKPVYVWFKRLLHMRYNPSPKELSEMDVWHLYNCDYILGKLLNGVTTIGRTHYYCGPIDESYTKVDKNNAIEKKENVIAYNPKKADETLIRKVIEYVRKFDTSLQFIRIEDMNLEEVKNTLLRSKVYMDLGYFPGPERIPREAVSLYCNIISSMTGAAANNTDVPIPLKFKFDIKDENIEQIAKTVIFLISNYEENIFQFDKYRAKVRRQIENLDNEVNEIIQML